MKIGLCCGDAAERYRLVECIRQHFGKVRPVPIPEEMDGVSALTHAMRETRFDILILSLYGNEGLEAANAARSKDSRVSIIWFSDCEEFGRQAYRLRVKDFRLFPVSCEDFGESLSRCRPLMMPIMNMKRA